ncbi:hypothetical protein VE02_08422 [Pseudogymnoascus sp. 03VT05]|nr:hypothetical protein VE02_08422 [Pseudogymnoascus sp. 03VT05]
MRRQFIEMIELNVRIEAINSGLEVLGESSEEDLTESPQINGYHDDTLSKSEGSANSLNKIAQSLTNGTKNTKKRNSLRDDLRNGTLPPVARDTNAPKPAAPVPMLNIGDETPTSLSEPLVDEIASCLREWHSANLHELLLSRQYPLLDKMTSLVQGLDKSRQQLLHNVLTTHEVEQLREKTIWDLVKGNKLVSGEVIVRSPTERGRVLTGEDSAVEITSLQSMMSCLEENPQHQVESVALHHLLVDVKGFPESRSGMVSRENLPSSVGEKSSLSGSVGKSARRSLMWGKSSQRATHSRNSPVPKMSSVAEKDLEQPPKTSDSKTGRTPPRTAGGKVVSRTVGVGALKLNSIMKQDADVEQVMSIWTPSADFNPDSQTLGEGWDEVIRDLLESNTGCYEKSAKAERMHLSLRHFASEDGESLIKATPTLLSNVSRTNKLGFSGAPTKPRSDIYVTIDKATLPRGALLSRAAGSATAMSTQMTCHNLQVTMEVRRATGDRIENCIYPSSNGEPVSSWESTVTERGEAWNQTIRLAVPPQEVPGCHLAILVSDAPNQPFAISHLPLWNQQAFIRDGHHSLLMYKYDETTTHTRPDTNGRGGYLGAPWNARGKDDVSKDEAITGPLSKMRVQTYLCSTRFSQDKVLLGLLNWKDQSIGELSDLLKRLVFVPEIEIVKLLNDVLDAMFAVLVEHAGNDTFEDLVFNALVTVLGIVHDRRFNLGPLVDHYAETQFNYPFATPCLVRSFVRLLSDPTDAESSKRLRATFKVTRHILKFITHARGQQIVKEADIGISNGSPGFSRHLRGIFKALDVLMRNTAPILVGSQTLAVQHFQGWLPELTGLLSTEEILHIAIDFMDSCSAVKGKLVLYKLILIINYAKLELFSQSDQKAALATNTVRWIAPHWGKTAEVTSQWHDQVRLCCSVLSTQIEMLGPEIPDHIPKIIDSYLAIQGAPRRPSSRLSLLFPSSYPFPTKPIEGSKPEFDEALVELSAILSAVSNRPQGMQLELAEDEMSTLLQDALRVHTSILESIGWETTAEEKQRYGLQKIGGYQVQYVPGLVGPIVELCLSVHEGLRRVAVEVLQTMIASEWNLSEDLSTIQMEMIDSLDLLFKSKPLTESILQKFFVNELLDLFEPLSTMPDDNMYASLSDMIATIDEFLDLLVAVYSADNANEASGLIDRLRLMDFLRDMQKEEIFIRYVHQLSVVQAESRNFTEAGLALRLHADLYDWDPLKILPPLSDPDFPAQSAFERKERIYFDMIKHFEEGDAWSSALVAYKELREQYEENVFDFSKLARTQRAIGSVYECIAKSNRPMMKYFRVAYRGLGFPPGVRDKEFVFEGAPAEKTSAFTDHLQEQYPGAQIQFATTVSRNTSGPVEEHFAEKMVYITADQFPTISRRSEIITVERIRLSPLQTALERTVRKTQEMTSVERKAADGDEAVVPLLVEAISISVSHSSESSIARYRALLPLPSFDEDGEEQVVILSPLESALKMALIDHAIMIKRILTMFSRSMHPTVRYRQEELTSHFESTFGPELVTLAPVQPRQITPAPTWSVASPQLGSDIPSPPQPLPSLKHSSTMQTTSSMPESPTRRRELGKLNFLNRPPKTGPPVSFKGGQGRKENSDEGSSMHSGVSRGKENRRSFFGRGDSEEDWNTDTADGSGLRRSESHGSEGLDRPTTATSVGSKVGSVRKRLSKLTLGRKESRKEFRAGVVIRETE